MWSKKFLVPFVNNPSAGTVVGDFLSIFKPSSTEHDEIRRIVNIDINNFFIFNKF